MMVRTLCAKARYAGLVAFLLSTLSLCSGVCAEPLKFITIDVAPWAFKNPESGQLQGGFVEMAREIAKRTDYEIDITLTPFARVDRELESGGHDCTILIPRPESVVERGALVSYHHIGVVPKKGLTLEGYESLHDLTISVLRGAAITPRFDSDDSLDTVYDTDYLIALRKLSRGRVDAIAGAIPTIRYLADHNQLGGYIGEPLPLAEVPLYFQCSRQSDHLDAMAAINHAIEQMKVDGTIEAIKKIYYF